MEFELGNTLMDLGGLLMATAEGGEAAPAGGLDLGHIWQEMSIAAKAVVFTLFALGLGSLGVGIERLMMLAAARSSSAEFAKKVRPLLQEGEFEDAHNLSKNYPKSPLAQLMGFGLKSFLDNREDEVLGPVELATREMSRRLEDLSAQARRGLGILATTGSTAPFVGLFGTVVGIIVVFTSMAADGGGGFETVSAGIAEALIVTGLGLVIAIFAVWIFNFITNRLEHMDMQMQHASSEMVDFLESKGGH